MFVCVFMWVCPTHVLNTNMSVKCVRIVICNAEQHGISSVGLNVTYEAGHEMGNYMCINLTVCVCLCVCLCVAVCMCV